MSAITKELEAGADKVAGEMGQRPKVSSTGANLPVAREAGGHVIPAPQTYQQMLEMAQLMATGQSMVGKAFRGQVGACMAILQQAMRLGFDPYMMSQKAYLVNETIGYEAQLVHAIILKNAPLIRRPRSSYSGEGATRQCTIDFFCEGEPEPLSYTSPQFKDIQPKNSPLWKTDPDQQLHYYSVRACARRHFPEILMGMYSPDEIEDARDDGSHDIITLGGAAVESDQAADAEFTSMDTLLAKNAAAKEKPAQPKPDEPKETSTRETSDADDPPGKDQPTPEAAVDKPADAAPTDEEIVAGVEAAWKAAPRSDKVTPIKSKQDELVRIAEESTDADLKKRANALLNRYEL